MARRPATFTLLAPDAATVRTVAAQNDVLSPLRFSEGIEDDPALAFEVPTLPTSALWTPRCVVLIEYDDPESGDAYDIEMWRVVSIQDTADAERTVTCRPLWGDMADHRVVPILDADGSGTGVPTLRLSLVARTLPSALGVIFDPSNGAPARSSGAPLFAVGDVDEALRSRLVNVSAVAPSVLEALNLACEDARAVWEAECIPAGDGPEDVYYRIHARVPPEAVAAVYTKATGGTSALVLAGEFGNDAASLPAGVPPSTVSLRVSEDTSSLVTAILPVLGDEANPVTAAAARYAATNGAASGGGYAVDLVAPGQQPWADFQYLAVPYDGWNASGYVRDITGAGEGDWTEIAIVSTEAPRTLVLASAPALGREIQILDAQHNPILAAENADAVATYGRIEAVRFYGDIPPYPNLYLEDAYMASVEAVGAHTVPVGWDAYGPSTVVSTLTTVERDVSMGDASCRVSLPSAGSGIRYTVPTGALATGFRDDRTLFLSLRVETGSATVTVSDFSSHSSSVTVGEAYVLGTVEIVLGEGEITPSTFIIEVEADEASTVVVLDAICLTPSQEAYSPTEHMGPEAAWARAWDEVLREAEGVLSADSDVLDPYQFGVGAERLRAGAWVRVHAHGRATFEAQVIEAAWEETVGLVSRERRLRLGTARPSLSDRLRTPPPVAKQAPGSRTSFAGYGYVQLDAEDGTTYSEAPAYDLSGWDGATFTTSTRTVSFIDANGDDADYTIDVVDIEPPAAEALTVTRRRDGDLVLCLADART